MKELPARQPVVGRRRSHDLRHAPARIVLLAVLVLGLGSGAESKAESGSERQQELERLRSEISRLQDRLQALQHERRGLAGELARTETALALQQARVGEARLARDLAAERLAASEAEVARLEEALEAVQKDLQRRLTALYRLGQFGYLRLFLSLDRDQDVLPAVRVLRYLARRDADARQRYQETRSLLAIEQEQLVERRKEVEAWLVREEARRRELSRLERRQRALLAEVEERRRRLARRTEELADKERRLSSLIDFLYGRTGVPLAGTPIQDFRGVLDWPARGRVQIGFGPQRDPRYGTRVPHNGVLLATERGAAVRTIYPGQVLFAAPLEGYGRTVVVHHPERVFSLYAGMSSLSVSQGDILSIGQRVGAADGELYFEIRLHNRPQDPLAWLR